MRNLRRIFSLIGLALVLGLPAVASAQSDFNFESFQPLPSQSTNTLGVARSEVLGHLTPSFGLMLHLQDDPLQIGDGDDVRFRLVDTQLKTEVSAALGFFGWIDLGVIMPIAVYQDGETAAEFGYTDEVSAFALSDLRIVPKIRFLKPEWTGGVGAALLVPVTLPTGDEVFNSDGVVSVAPTLALDYVDESGFKFAVNAGLQVRERREAFNYVSGNTFTWGAATEIPLGTEKVLGLGTLSGAISVEDKPEALNEGKIDPTEFLLGARFLLPGSLLAQVAGGGGITDGVGAPDFRVVAGLAWSPRDDDADDDGIKDDVDQCPAVAEDMDGFEDEDGCPDLDNDGDGILDIDDKCPNVAEDLDGFEDDDGCVDSDNDQDGVIDADDDCPDTAGPSENSGCPWGDRDKDGLADNVDQCPEQPEDMDGFQDDDGCPDLDNDGDRIADAVDKCPMEPEVINGFQDDDGCPDEGETKVKVTEKKIEILEKIYFDTNKATIKQQSFNVLDQVSSVLKLYPQIKKVRIEGHTDSRGRDEYNKQLSQERARSVKQYVTDKGVEASRLEAVGYGEEKPISDNATAEGRDRNRRVEFTILEAEKIIEETPVEEPEITNTTE